jgi:hypothetical protein
LDTGLLEQGGDTVNRIDWHLIFAVYLSFLSFGNLSADDLVVTNEAEFNAALDNALDGDRILLA